MEFGHLENPLGYMDPMSRGIHWQRWLDNPTDTSCPVPRSTLTLNDLAQDGWFIEQEGSRNGWRFLAPECLQGLPRSIREAAMNVGLPNKQVYRLITVRKITTGCDGCPSMNQYDIMVGPGCIFALVSVRCDGPNWSEIALAVYRHFQTEQLRYVFRVNVVNYEAKETVKQLYPELGLQWPDYEPRVWAHGTSEYTTLLGTVNVRGVAALVLGGFDRGTKTIRKVYTWACRGRQLLQIMVPIADVDRSDR